MASHNALHPCILPPLSNFKMGCLSNPFLRNTHFSKNHHLKGIMPFQVTCTHMLSCHIHTPTCFQVTCTHMYAWVCVTRLQMLSRGQMRILQFLLAMLVRGELLTRSRKTRRPTTRPSYLLLCKMHCLCFPNPCANTYPFTGY